MMKKFRRRPVVIHAVQWFPDERLGRFSGGGYVNKSVGEDCHGICYLVTEVGLYTRQGFMRIEPGDWIAQGEDNRKWVVEGSEFGDYYEAV